MSSTEHLSDRAVIRISGDERKNFLQGLITQDIDHLSGGNAIAAALLTPQGKILFDFILADNGDAYLLDCCKDAAPALVKRLTLYKLRAKVAIELDANLSVRASTDEIEGGFMDPRHPELGWRAITKHSDGQLIGDYKERRIALGVPEFGEDFASEDVFLLDVNYDRLNAVSYQKGCFVGQEVTSRMKRKGEARKRTLIVTFEGDALTKGASVTAGDSTLGEILSSGANKALALIRLDRWEAAKAAGFEPESDGRALQLQVPDYFEQA